MATNALPRGIRNNNPLNLRISNNPWLGKVKNNTDGAFEQFTAIEYGLRAAFRNIQTIVKRRERNHLTTTIKDLIHIWAPASDGNNETVYCKTIADKTALQPNDTINLKSKNFMCLLVYGMAWQENGQAVSMGRIESGYYLAFGPNDPRQLQIKKDNTD